MTHKTNHTPGPWSVGGPYDHMLMTARGELIASTALMSKNHKADARLIAAAPDLLAALESITEHFRANGDPTASDLMSAGRAAIARARGEG